MKQDQIKAAVIWMTGLSGSGKTTLAVALISDLKSLGLKVEHLDGDTIRAQFPGTGFGRQDRIEHLKRVSKKAAELESSGALVVASFISPFRESREFARGLCHNFFEVYLSTPLAECEKRDPKGLYKKARAGELKDFTGIDSPFEIPEKAELTIDTSLIKTDAAVKLILERLELI